MLLSMNSQHIQLIVNNPNFLLYEDMSLQAQTQNLALQEDLPANNINELGGFQHSLEEELKSIGERVAKRVIDTKPFYRYSSDGLTGLL